MPPGPGRQVEQALAYVEDLHGRAGAVVDALLGALPPAAAADHWDSSTGCDDLKVPGAGALTGCRRSKPRLRTGRLHRRRSYPAGGLGGGQHDVPGVLL